MFYLKIQDAFEYQLFKNLGARADIGNGPVILNVIPSLPTLDLKIALLFVDEKKLKRRLSILYHITCPIE